MEKISLDTSSFSEQLGIYDFFNVIVSGAIFICGFFCINDNWYEQLFKQITMPKVLVLIVLVYIMGLVLQEIGSLIDTYILKVYVGATRNFLKGSIDDEENIDFIIKFGRYIKKIFIKKHKKQMSNSIICNPVLLERYNVLAKEILKDIPNDILVESTEGNINAYVFSVCQYSLAYYGKDKKVEKMRALFGMAKSLMTCFFILDIITFIEYIGLVSNEQTKLTWLLIIFTCFTIVFRCRMGKIMRRMMLILLGTYDALIRGKQIASK